MRTGSLILPDATKPWAESISRRHAPRIPQGSTEFRAFRQCLRWEFGFSCAFCLCHEGDYMGWAEGEGVFQIEHFKPKSRDPGAISDHENLFYICRRCNRSHSARPVQGPNGEELLNPCKRPWGAVFALVEDRLEVLLEGEKDAEYTQELFTLNAPSKVRLRRLRRSTIGDAIAGYRNATTRIRGLLRRPRSPERESALSALAKLRNIHLANLRRFRAVPLDRRNSCACGDSTQHSLPKVLADQTNQLRDLLGA